MAIASLLGSLSVRTCRTGESERISRTEFHAEQLFEGAQTGREKAHVCCHGDDVVAPADVERLRFDES